MLGVDIDPELIKAACRCPFPVPPLALPPPPPLTLARPAHPTLLLYHALVEHMAFAGLMCDTASLHTTSICLMHHPVLPAAPAHTCFT